MKLAVGYVVFDGLETLEHSLKSIRSNADIVIVSYQTVSWTGFTASPALIPTLEKLKADGLIDHLIEFKEFTPLGLRAPVEVMQAKSFELLKRQGCLNLARELGATHYTSMDADEFYREKELAWAKSEIEKGSIDATAIRYINYVTPTLHRGHSRWLIPFIYRITPTCCHHSAQKLFKGVDPTRGVFDENYSKIRIFEKDQISMHHMEMVRHDLISKYRNASRFFQSRAGIMDIERDIRISRETGVLKFLNQHLGDSDNPREEYKLIECDNEFGIVF